MSMLNDPNLTKEIDLLVDGELPEDARRTLLLGLDAAPQGWRQCALAFLEAQGWRQAFGEVTRELPAPSMESNPRRFPIRVWLASAAALLMAFGTGWIVRPSQPAQRNVVVMNQPQPPKPLPAPNRPTPSIAKTQRPVPIPVDYARGRLERSGYRLEQTRALISGTTRDGRKVAVPVHRTTVRFVGNRSV